jgi:hypothetical protein
MFTRIGYEIINKQTDVLWHDVPGHTDTEIRTDTGQRYLIEAKTSSDYYWKDCNRRGYPDDSRGYLTQLVLYADALAYDADNVVWVMLNKSTQELAVLPLSNVPEEVREEKKERAKELIELYRQTEDLEDVFRLSQPPPPSIEKDKEGNYQRHENGMLKLYPSYTVNYPKELYIMEEGRTKWGAKRNYVIDYNYPLEYQRYKPNIIEDAKSYDES